MRKLRRSDRVIHGSLSHTARATRLEGDRNPAPRLYARCSCLTRGVLFTFCIALVLSLSASSLGGQAMDTYVPVRTLWLGDVASIAFSPDGRLMAVGRADAHGRGNPHAVLVLDTATWEVVHILHGNRDRIWSVAFSYDGTLLAAGGDDGDVRVWRTGSWDELISFPAHTQSIESLAFSPDGTRLVTGSWDRTVRVWSVALGWEIRTWLGHYGPVESVAFHPSGQWVASGSHDMTIRVWDVAADKAVKTLVGHSSRIYSVQFGPGGEVLASGSWDGTVKLWDWETAVLRGTLHSTGDAVWSTVWATAFRKDSRVIACGDASSVVLWDVQTGEALGVLRGHQSTVIAVAFSPDGTILSSGAHDGTLRIWDVSQVCK